jgi:transcriptional regulator with XRE-family HTH domain
LGNRILEARTQHLDVSQNELARRLGLASGVTISRWERGAAEPSIGMIRALASESGLPVNWFFNGDEEAA